MTIDIVPARPSELPALVSLLQSHGLPPEGLADHLETTLVARHNSEVVGSAALELYGEVALLRSVAVASAWQGHGLGQRLTEAALALAPQHGVRQLFLLTETADDFFPRFGFAPTPRANVPPALLASREFMGACPASARLFSLRLAPDAAPDDAAHALADG